MPFLTDSGLFRLKLFAQQVQDIYDAKYEDKQHSSAYSKKMAENALEIILKIIEKNEVNVTSFKDFKKLIASIEPLIKHIDNKKFNAVPCVFNGESLQLAKAFREYINTLDLSVDICKEFNFVLQLKSAFSNEPSSAILKQHVREIDANIRLYELIISAKKSDQEAKKILIEINKFREQYPRKWSGDLEAAKLDYQTKVSALLRQIEESKLFSVGLKQGGIEEYLGREEPFNITLDNLYPQGLADLLYSALGNLEFYFNKEILKNKETMTLVDEHCKRIYTREKVESNKTAVIQELKQLENQITAYLAEKRSIFNGIPPEKRKIMESLSKNVSKALDCKYPDSRSAFSLYKDLVICGENNANFSKSKKISPGKCGRICLSFQPIMLSLAFDRVVGSNEQYYQMFNQVPSALATSASLPEPKEESARSKAPGGP